METQRLNALIVEDNLGDFVLLKDLFDGQITNSNIAHAESFTSAKRLLEDNRFDIIFLDLSLPDCSGNDLVVKIVGLAANTPILVLTGYSDKEFGVQALSLGVSDYLLKDELNAQDLKKTVLYSIERTKISSKLKESEEKYRAIFYGSPLPMWVYDIETYDFLDVNEAAIQSYGFSREQFLQMNFKDLIPENSVDSVNEILEICNNTNGFLQTVSYHVTSEKEIIKVELQSNEIEFERQKARLIVANNITQKTRAEEALQFSERRFKALVQKGSDVFSILDSRGEYLYIGDNAKSILGIPPKAFENKSLFYFIHPEDVESVRTSFQHIFDHHSIQVPPYRFLSDSGYIWLETIITNLIDDPSVAGIVGNSKNITDKIESELELKRSNERYNIVSRATSDIIWDCDLINNTATWNRGLSRTFGYPREMQTTPISWAYDKIHPDDLDKVRSGFKHNFDNKLHLWQEEYRFRCADGTYRHIFDRGFVVYDEDGTPLRFIGAMQDITQHKIEELRLKLLESVVTNSTDAMIIFVLRSPSPDQKLAFDAEITFVNDTFTKITGIAKEEAIGNSFHILDALRITRSNLLHAIRSLRDYKSFSFEFSYSGKDGQIYFLHLSMIPVADGSQKLTHWAAIVNDITERTKKEHEITKAIMGAQELERYEIGCELHDNINQILSATQLALGMTKDADQEDSRHWIRQAGNYIDLAIDEIRRLSHRLAPNSLDGTTFDEAVLSLVKSLNVNNRIQFSVHIDSEYFQDISPDIQINLYRIIQEQLNNIIKHSRAKNVSIKSTMSDEGLTLTIKDDGIGFNIYTVKKGIGLNNIMKRCDIIHAKLSIKSEINKGCELVIVLNSGNFDA